MTLRLSARWIAVLAMLVPLPALAQVPPANPVPANSVRCVEQTLSIEDREIALLLMFVRYGDSGDDRATWLRGVIVAERLLNDGRNRCRTAHRWTLAKAVIARDYAFHALAAEAMGQLVEAEGVHLAAPIETYFNSHRARLARKSAPADEQDQTFVDFLANAGWDREDESELRLARKYLDALIKLDEDRRRFSAGAR